jgi:hypothetical protein
MKQKWQKNGSRNKRCKQKLSLFSIWWVFLGGGEWGVDINSNGIKGVQVDTKVDFSAMEFSLVYVDEYNLQCVSRVC